MDYRPDASSRRVRRVGVAEALAGLDLAGSEKRITGLAIGDSTGRVLLLREAGEDKEILELLIGHRVTLVALDAPLSHAQGYRHVDLEARRRGFKLLPPGWRGMRMLVERALRLGERLEANGVRVIETHPRSALLNAGCSYDEWRRCLSSYLSLEDIEVRRLSRDLVDALIALAVAVSYAKGAAEVIKGNDGEIWLLPGRKHG